MNSHWNKHPLLRILKKLARTEHPNDKAWTSACAYLEELSSIDGIPIPMLLPEDARDDVQILLDAYFGQRYQIHEYYDEEWGSDIWAIDVLRRIPAIRHRMERRHQKRLKQAYRIVMTAYAAERVGCRE